MVDSLEQADNPPPQQPQNSNFWLNVVRPSKKKAIGVTAIASVVGLRYL